MSNFYLIVVGCRHKWRIVHLTYLSVQLMVKNVDLIYTTSVSNVIIFILTYKEAGLSHFFFKSELNKYRLLLQAEICSAKLTLKKPWIEIINALKYF